MSRLHIDKIKYNFDQFYNIDQYELKKFNIVI
mgnify:CR=1 FL=1